MGIFDNFLNIMRLNPDDGDEFFNEDDRFRKFKTYKYGIIHVSVYWR